MRVLPTLALLAALVAPPALAADLTGRVVGITDGDTLTLLTPDRRQTRIRLAEIDTPERGQPYGSRAREALSGLAFGRPARVTVADTDRYGRTVGRVVVAGKDVNREMVRLGAAWVYRAYSRDPALPAVEAEARAARRGLWGLPEAERMPPWEWRRTPKTERPSEPAAARARRPASAPG
ncbi:thermonuclease family protein [Paracraurococcus lichenis]|uniref:Thermonuclease family protein n=1 Tax=Paracraurococcus lichenis TaxID=3064888 RepID=A0ABT9DWZ2_9PROT|nr:thermonuclease family protein [Paracraurococcus sp. LOR1-02]MDO9708421.1 thermonuclease family protein [Paracraurococcus sp. LOR1-02]